ncbi:MAG: hypothetical protein ACRD4E_17185 [Bryobacteraceae bacterium]
MTGLSHPIAEAESQRWKAVRRGLRLANSYLGLAAIGWFYAVWCLIGLILCFVFIPFAISGKTGAFEKALKPVALCAFVLPSVLMAATTWAVKLFSRLLWCAIPEPSTATILAYASVAGRLSVLGAAVYVWLWGGPYAKGLLLPATVALSGIAWLGLAAEWGLIRILRHEFIRDSDPAMLNEGSGHFADDGPEERVTEPRKKSVLKRDVGEWLQGRFPRLHKFVVWILFPTAYVAVSSLSNDGDLQAIPTAILRLAVIGPAVLQAFWIPGTELERLRSALSTGAREDPCS